MVALKEPDESWYHAALNDALNGSVLLLGEQLAETSWSPRAAILGHPKTRLGLDRLQAKGYKRDKCNGVRALDEYIPSKVNEETHRGIEVDACALIVGVRSRASIQVSPLFDVFLAFLTSNVHLLLLPSTTDVILFESTALILVRW